MKTDLVACRRHGDWEQGEPEIMVTDGPCDNTMNPTKDETYTFLAKFLKEVGITRNCRPSPFDWLTL